MHESFKDIFSEKDYYYCSVCGMPRVWWRFQQPINHSKPLIGFCCKSKRLQLDETLKEKLEIIYIEKRLQRLIKICMANKMTDLREHLFDALQQVKKDEMEVGKAKSICEIAQTIINSVKVEVEAIKALGGAKKSTFLELEAVSD